MVWRARAILVMVFVAIATSTASRPAQPDAAPCRLPGTTGPLCWGLIGNDRPHLAAEHAAGIRYKVFSLGWISYMPEQGAMDASYVEGKRAELAAMRAAGFGVILSLGLHDPPSWIHDAYGDSYYVDQYGDQYTDQGDAGDANLIFNDRLRRVAADYIQQAFATFGTDFAAVRLGGGRYGELTYPPSEYNGRSNCYWAFDADALARSPVPDWRPGGPGRPRDVEAFVNWYLDALVDFQNWQIETVRAAGYRGALMMLYPSWGLRPGDIEGALRMNLNGSTSAEMNGEIQRGFDFARQIAAIRDPGVIVTTTWLDADASGDGDVDPGEWSPVKYLATLAHANPMDLAVYGENTGQGAVEQMQLSAAQVLRYGLTGMAWFNESELFSGQYATLDDYRRIIAAYPANP